MVTVINSYMIQPEPSFDEEPNKPSGPAAKKKSQVHVESVTFTQVS